MMADLPHPTTKQTYRALVQACADRHNLKQHQQAISDAGQRADAEQNGEIPKQDRVLAPVRGHERGAHTATLETLPHCAAHEQTNYEIY